MHIRLLKKLPFNFLLYHCDSPIYYTYKFRGVIKTFLNQVLAQIRDIFPIHEKQWEYSTWKCMQAKHKGLPLTTRTLGAFACGYFSPKWQRKGGEKTLNPNGCCMKSIYRIVQDDLMGSLNTV